MNTHYQTLKQFSVIIRNCIMVIMLFHFNCLTAQNYFGVVLDNYSGVNSLQANPAGICYQPFKFDINILGVDAYINNNNFYTDATNTVKLLFSSS